MNTLTIVALACLAVFASAKPSGHWGHGHDGHWDDGHWDDGSWDDGSWDDGHWGHHSNVVHAHGATVVGPSVHGHGGDGGWGHGWVGGHGWAGDHGHGHGVVVKGPPTVPATIVGPSGKVHADGLWGPTHAHGHGGHGHHW